jgi:hypothetical protein
MSKPSDQRSGGKNMNNLKCDRSHVLAIKLKRTDTTLDLSQKAFELLAGGRARKNVGVGRNLQRELKCRGGEICVYIHARLGISLPHWDSFSRNKQRENG